VSQVEARVQAIQALYAADASETEPDTTELSARAGRLVDGVWEHRAEIDGVISRVATGWRIERMPLVDRNVLRLGVYELLYTETPVGVVVSEAVEIAKEYSTAKSGAFVNGVLGKLADVQREAGRLPK
jgi:N utilization substance protein B